MESREQIRLIKAENTTIESFQFHAQFNGIFNLPLILALDTPSEYVDCAAIEIYRCVASAPRNLLISGNHVTRSASPDRIVPE